MRGFYLKLASADASGSICYSILKGADGGWSETYRDGQWTELSDESRIWGIKIWLEGDVSDDFDLSIRCCTEKTGWGLRHESFKVDAEHAPEITFAGERLIAFQLEAVPRPVGAIKLLADFRIALRSSCRTMPQATYTHRPASCETPLTRPPIRCIARPNATRVR